MSRTVPLLLLALLVAGCSSTGVVPIGQDTFMISKGGSGSGSGGALKAECYQEGNSYCKSLGKEFQPLCDNNFDAVSFRLAAAEIQFRCLSRGDPELSRPTMNPIPNVRIESDIREKKDIKESHQLRDSEDMYAELRKLKYLFDSEVITQSEFEAQKAKILGRY